ncbi:MAG: complex I NDUFA9 subunit family protein [Proteobacteria bacterium]|nr:complex I NDUFA9 subunit family protein [Pseudomonadota bacterium]
MDQPVVTVFGGSGFLGRHLVKRLADAGRRVRVAVRDVEAANFLKIDGDVGQIVPWPADITNPTQVAAAVEGADQVVNLVGILYERGRRTFQRIHVEGATNVAAAATAAGVRALVHVSALGADEESPALYGRTKAAGEAGVRKVFPGAAIIRPSVVFGPEDNFFNLFAGLSRLMPVLPVFGCPLWPRIILFPEGGLVDIDLYGDGGTKFQPVYVGDVAEAIMRILARPGDNASKTYELGGPAVYSFKEIMELLLREMGRKRFLAPVPFGLAKFYAWFLEFWPKPLLTRDQVSLLMRDNVVSPGADGFGDLGIDPVTAESILPMYLRRFRPPVGQGFNPA